MLGGPICQQGLDCLMFGLFVFMLFLVPIVAVLGAIYLLIIKFVKHRKPNRYILVATIITGAATLFFFVVPWIFGLLALLVSQ